MGLLRDTTCGSGPGPAWPLQVTFLLVRGTPQPFDTPSTVNTGEAGDMVKRDLRPVPGR
jgi:hypothetical protein